MITPGKHRTRFGVALNYIVIHCSCLRVNLPSGEGDVSDSNSSEELESVIEESEPDQHIDFVSLGST